MVDHPQLMYETRIRMISPFGRAVINKIPMNRQSPTCFNLRSICRRFRDFKYSMAQLRGLLKFCTPSINIDGTIAAGENNGCTTIGTVTDNNLVLTNRLCSMTCRRCGLVDNLIPELKKVIGEE